MQLQSKTLTAHDINGIVYYTFPAFDAVPFVRHGFSTRLGGVSKGIYADMNLSYTRGDDPAAVRENFDHTRSRARAATRSLTRATPENSIPSRRMAASLALSGVNTPIR